VRVSENKEPIKILARERLGGTIFQDEYGDAGNADWCSDSLLLTITR
jgi:hypothetical protein